MKKNLSFHYKPTVTRKDLVEVFQTLISDKLTLEDGGNQVLTFEKKIASSFKGMKAIMVNSDSAAMYLIAMAMQIKPGDEVLVSSFAEPFILETLLFCKAVVRVIDVQKNSLLMNLNEAENTINKKTKAIIYSYPFGCGNITGLQKFYKTIKANNNNIFLVEDCSAAFGSKVVEEKNEIMAGSVGNFSLFSLSSSRILTAGKGACILCKKKSDVANIKNMRGRGKVDAPLGDDKLQHRLDFIPTEIEATLASSQFSMLPQQLKRRSEILEKLKKATEKKWHVALPNNFLRNETAHIFLVETHDEKLMIHSAFKSGKLHGLADCQHVAYFYLGENIISNEKGLPFSLDVISRLLVLQFPLDINDEAVSRAESLLRTTARIAKSKAV